MNGLVCRWGGLAAALVIGLVAATEVEATENSGQMPEGQRQAPADAAAGDEADDVLRYELSEEETLATVALEFGIHINDLKEWNDLETVHDVAPQDTIEIYVDEDVEVDAGPDPVVHVIGQGDTLEGIASRYGVTVSQVRQWNRQVDPRRLQLGQHIHLNVPGEEGEPVSWGRANSGRLYNGIVMEDSPGLWVRNAARAYGTQRVINLLAAGVADVKARWPDAPELVVGSLSLRQGGPIRPHRSHQSGRDADATYYYRGNVALPDFHDMRPETFDAVKNWHLFKTLIDTGEVQFIFVEYELQEVLYDYARSIGFEEEELSQLLQYPRGQHTPVGIIRHAGGHRNHFHIRFHCGDGDQNCR